MNIIRQTLMTSLTLVCITAITQMARASITMVVDSPPPQPYCGSVDVKGSDVVPGGYNPETGNTITVVNGQTGDYPYFPNIQNPVAYPDGSYQCNWGTQTVPLYSGVNVITVSDSYGQSASMTIRLDGSSIAMLSQVEDGCPTGAGTCGAKHQLNWYCLTAGDYYYWNEDSCTDTTVITGHWGSSKASSFGYWSAPDTSGWTCPSSISSNSNRTWTIASSLTDVTTGGPAVWQGSIERDWTRTYNPPNNQITVVLSGDVNGTGRCTRSP
jgi:hypothetical protein